MTSLPIHELESRIAEALRSQPRLVLSAPTGSGKSTQVPQMLLRNGFLEHGQAVILQPRRLPTRLLARRVAQELGVELGREVGYQVRFDNVTSAATRIRFVTEGLLLRQMLQDPALDGVAALIFDEFHERHLHGDLSLARAVQLQRARRPDLLIVVMSATLDSARLKDYLDPCVVLTASGRTFPVEIDYADTPAYANRLPVWEQAADAFAAWARRGEPGDALVFMPGAHEIQRTLEALRARPETRGRILLPLHGELPPHLQDAAVAPHDRPKVVVATNVAETSLTIEGIRLVIDSGLARLPRHDPARGINTLLVERISRASADQRAGRAGRTAPGVCMRLWSAEEHHDRPAHEVPEIRRLDLAEAVLTLIASGTPDVRQFPWFEPPEDRALDRALELLADLGAIAPVSTDPAGEPPSAAPAEGVEPPPQSSAFTLTPLGRRMLAFPLHPRYARLLLAAAEQDCVYHAALLAALTQGRDILLRKVDAHTARFREDRIGDRSTSDFFRLIRAWEFAAANDFRRDACERAGIHAAAAAQVPALLHSFLSLARREGMDTTPRELHEDRLRLCILQAFSDHLARRLDRGTLRCELVHRRRGMLSRDSAVQDAPLLVAAEVREIESRGDVETILSLATAVEPAWIRRLFPDDIRSDVHVTLDSVAKRVVAQERVLFRDLPLETKRVEPPPEEPAARLLAAEVIAGRLTLPLWDHSVEQWILRLNQLARWCPEFGLPPLGPEDRQDLIAQLCMGAFSHRDVRERPVRPLVTGWLNAAQRELLDRHAPERLELPNGRRPKVTYTADGPPFIALRIQELYGVRKSPRIALDRVAVTVHILAPSMRPVQITQDLESFWSDHYPRIKSELQRKYPKHEWR